MIKFFIFFNMIINYLYFATTFYFLLPLILSISSGFLCGCCPYVYQKEIPIYETSETNATIDEATQHWLYEIVPPHRNIIRWYDLGHTTTWMLFGNDDDGIFGESQSKVYRPEQQPSILKATRWWLRNPLHNFCFYVIGSAERQNSEIDLLKINSCHFSSLHYRPIGTTVFGGKGTSFYLGLHGWKPFISLRIVYPCCRRTDFYLGWRERGNFGIKFLPFTRTLKYNEGYY